MKERFLNSTVNFLKKYNSYSDKDIKKLRYGLEGIYLTFTKMIVILVLALLLGILKEVVIVLVLFNIIRYFGFGFHAEKSWECLVLSLMNFVLVPLLIIKLEISFTMSLIICGVCLVSYLLFAPADTVKRPLLNKKKRLIRKVLTLGVGIIYSLIIIILNNTYLNDLLLSAMIVQAIVINPIIYKVFRQPYNNYKNLV